MELFLILNCFLFYSIDAELENIMKKIDNDGDGEISFEEFFTIIQTHLK